MRFSKIHPLFKSLQRDHTIARDSKLVIDAKMFLQNNYRDSGCQYLFGGEYDRYAEHLRKTLKSLKDIGVTCYVVFSGAGMSDMDRRLEIHQKIIDQKSSIDPSKKHNVFSEPIFAKHIFKEVLNELGIRYAISDYDYVVEMVTVAKYYRCPLLTRSVECSLFGVSCITPKSLTFEGNCISCKVYEPSVCRERIISAQDKLSIFLALMDDDKPYLRDLEQLIEFRENNMLYKVLQYTRRQTRDALLSDFGKQMNKTRYEMFLKDYNKIRNFMSREQDSLTLKHFQNKEIESEDWFVKAVITGRIPDCYVNLKNIGLFSGSWLISDISKADPMLPSMNIVGFAYELLTNFRSAKITFVGREGAQSKTWEIDSIGFQRPEGFLGDVFINGWSAELPDYFRYFIQVELPEFDFDTLNLCPADAQMLVIALVYYTAKIGGDNMALVYSVMLSYTMVGPVAEVTGMLKRSNLMQREQAEGVGTTKGLVEKDCFAAARALIDHFYANNVAEKFDRTVLHMFAEFEHCLQQLNNLNWLCGERRPYTIYHKCYNGTFIYNLFFEIRFMMEPMAEIEEKLNNSPSVLQYFKRLVGVFECCVESMKKK